MREPRGRRCKKRPVWRYHHNDLQACTRCDHHVWNTTRARLRASRTALGLLERGQLPAALAADGLTGADLAAAMLEELQSTRWRTGATHEVPQLVARGVRLVHARLPAEAYAVDLNAQETL